MFAPYFPQIEAYFILEQHIQILISYFPLKSYIHLDCLGNITVMALNFSGLKQQGRNFHSCYIHPHGILGFSWSSFIDPGQENFHLGASVIAEAGRKEHGELSIAFYYFYMKVRHVIFPPSSLSAESHMSMTHSKDVTSSALLPFDLKAASHKVPVKLLLTPKRGFLLFLFPIKVTKVVCGRGQLWT